ncbi:MAG: Gfo/Idh/MocA family protein [Acidimicrobiales bacterium]
MPIVVVSSRLSPGRREALVALVAPEGAPVFSDPVGFGPRALAPGTTAVLVDGPGLDHVVAEAERAGISLVALGTGVAGVKLLGPVPTGEVVVSVDDPTNPLAQRLDETFSVTDLFTPLYRPEASEIDDGDTVTVLSVNHRFHSHPAVVAGRRGAWRFVVSGLGSLDAALATPALATFLRRGLRAGLPAAVGRALGLGVVGYGRFGGMGLVHGTAAAAVDGLAFTATCDRDPERRKAAEHDFPGVRVHASIDELAADDDVDIAVVATPPVSHFDDVNTLLRAGKHVACEKPLCLTASQADSLIAEARAAGRVLTVNQSRRWDLDYLAVRRAVTAGLLGEVFNIETFVGGFEHPCRAWHSEESVSGGMVYDWGSHHVDWVLELMGSTPESVTAVGHKRVWHDVTNLDQLRVRMGWADGREAQFVCSDVAALRPPKFYLQGTAGTLMGTYRPVRFEHIDPARGFRSQTAHHAEAPADLSLVRYEGGVGLTETALPLGPEVAFGFHRNLADHLHLGDPLAVTASSVREVVAVLEGAGASASGGGRPVTPAPPPA